MEMLGYHHCDGKLGWTDYLHEGMLSVGYEIRRLTGRFVGSRDLQIWNRPNWEV